MPSEIFSFLQSQVNLQTPIYLQNTSPQEICGDKNGVFDALISEYSLQKNMQSVHPENSENVNVNLNTLIPENNQQILTFAGNSGKSVPVSVSVMTVSFSDGADNTEDVKPSEAGKEIGKWTDIFSGNKRLNDSSLRKTENIIPQNDFDEGVSAVADPAGDFSDVDVDVDADVPVLAAIPHPEAEKSEYVQTQTRNETQNEVQNKVQSEDAEVNVNKINADNRAVESGADTAPESTVKSSGPAKHSETELPVTGTKTETLKPENEPVTAEHTPEPDAHEPEAHNPEAENIATDDNLKLKVKTDVSQPETPETHEPVEDGKEPFTPETPKAVSKAPQKLKHSEHAAAKNETPETDSLTERFNGNETEPELIHREPELNGITPEINAETPDTSVSPEPSRKNGSSDVTGVTDVTEKDSRSETEPSYETTPEISEVTPDSIIVSGLSASQVNPQPSANEAPLHDDPDSPKTLRNVHAQSARKSQPVTRNITEEMPADSPETVRTTRNSQPNPEGINREADTPETQHSAIPEKDITESSVSAPRTSVRVSASSRRTGTAERNSETSRRTEAYTDFQSFFDGVTRTRRTTSRANTQPLSLRTGTYDSAGVQSQGHTMRNGIVNVVRFIRADGVHKASIVIDPPALGRISVELSSGTAGVEASVKVASEQIRQIVQNQIIQLRDNLLQQGVQVSEFTVDVQQDNTGQGNNHGGREQNQGGTYGFTGTDADDETEDFRIDLEEGLLYWVA